MRWIGLLLAGLLLFALLPAPAVAQSGKKYYESAELTYTINEDRSVDVEMEFTMVNDTLRTSVTWVSRSVGSVSLQNVQVYDSTGEDLRHEETVIPDQTIIKVYFDGKMNPGDRLTYFITFSAPDLVLGDGPRYEAAFGKLTVGTGDMPYNEYKVNVIGPPGTVLYYSEPLDVTVDGVNMHYHTELTSPSEFEGVAGLWYVNPAYYQVDLAREISVIGSKPITDMKLDVILFNNDDNWQFSALIDSFPVPETMYVDEENNLHATFDIGAIQPDETKDFNISMIYQVYVHDPEISHLDVGPLSSVPSNLSNFLEPVEYWESENQLIQDIASQLVIGTGGNAYLIAENIMNFVVGHLTYDNLVDYRGAVEAYQRGSGDCSNYTDLTIALCRATGIPARAAYGWGYSDFCILGHAWLEIYLPGVGWQPADPTWAEERDAYFAKLDSAHIQQSQRNVNSTEGYMTYTYWGATPAISNEWTTQEVTLLTKEQAAEKFLTAAELALDIATSLLENAGGGDNLNQAVNLVESAGNFGADQKIAMSQQATRYANVVIEGLGVMPDYQTSLFNLETMIMVIIIVFVVAGGAGVSVYAVKRGRRSDSEYLY